jgi:hypothetical protein
VDPETAAAIDLAKKSIEEAEHGLEKALDAIQSAPRAEKVTVSRVVEEAFEKLRHARALLATFDEVKPC